MLSKHFCKVFYNSFFRYIKISKKLSAKDYQEKEKLQKSKKKKEKEKKLVKDIKMFLKKKKKKQQNGLECYKNLSEDDEQKVVEYKTKYCKMGKNA